MYKKTIFVLLVLAAQVLLAQQNTAPAKYALVIGNGAYTNFGSLRNAVNDANDMAEALQSLGFTVDKVVNGNLNQMENAAIRLKNRLSAGKDSYGFFFYAGHAVQWEGENYLIPANANIPEKDFLRDRSISVQAVLSMLNAAHNSLNVVVLDACRDFPAAWSRSVDRGLAVVSNPPADSIIVYATGAGRTASDGTGRNGLFTGQLLKNLKTPGLEVNEVFRLTGADVTEVSKREQIPAVYNQFFGTAFLGERPVVRPPVVFEAGAANVATGALEIITVTAGTIQIRGMDIDQTVELPAWGSLPIEKINAGSYRVVMRYTDGRTEEKTVEVGRSESAKLEFNYRPAPLPDTPAQQLPAQQLPVQPPPSWPVETAKPASARLNTLGFSLGTSFADPAFIATVRGAVALGRYWFLELGLDLGLGSTYSQVQTYYSVYPFTHIEVFAPFNGKGGWYIGAGAGYMAGKYTFASGETPVGVFAADFISGFNFGNIFDISYTVRTNFSSASNKLSLGFVKRF